MRIPPKTQRIADRLKPRLPAKNYGLASGVSVSKLKLKGSFLSIVSPPYIFNSQKPLPTFLCATASRLAYQGAFKNKLDSSITKMAFLVMMGPGSETFTHGMCRTTEGGKDYLTGLTPFDAALGIRGVTRLDNYWEQFVVNEYQEIKLLTDDGVIESSGWDLLGKHESYYPFAARSYEGNRIGLLSLRPKIKNGSLCLGATSRIVYFHEASSAFIGEWASDLSIDLPLDRLDSAVRDIQQLGKGPDVFHAMRRSRYADYFEPDFDIKEKKYGAAVAALYNETLPALVNIAERLPHEEIAALAG